MRSTATSPTVGRSVRCESTDIGRREQLVPAQLDPGCVADRTRWHPAAGVATEGPEHILVVARVTLQVSGGHVAQTDWSTTERWSSPDRARKHIGSSRPGPRRRLATEVRARFSARYETPAPRRLTRKVCTVPAHRYGWVPDGFPDAMNRLYLLSLSGPATSSPTPTSACSRRRSRVVTQKDATGAGRSTCVGLPLRAQRRKTTDQVK
jgi:hypothetical protein